MYLHPLLDHMRMETDETVEELALKETCDSLISARVETAIGFGQYGTLKTQEGQHTPSESVAHAS